jgi:hypothetical protein
VQSHQIETTNAPASMPTNAPASIPTNVAASIPTNVAASLPTNDHTEALHFFQSIQCPCQAMLETAHSIWRQRERTLELCYQNADGHLVEVAEQKAQLEKLNNNLQIQVQHLHDEIHRANYEQQQWIIAQRKQKSLIETLQTQLAGAKIAVSQCEAALSHESLENETSQERLKVLDFACHRFVDFLNRVNDCLGINRVVSEFVYQDVCMGQAETEQLIARLGEETTAALRQASIDKDCVDSLKAQLQRERAMNSAVLESKRKGKKFCSTARSSIKIGRDLGDRHSAPPSQIGSENKDILSDN